MRFLEAVRSRRRSARSEIGLLVRTRLRRRRRNRVLVAESLEDRIVLSGQPTFFPESAISIPLVSVLTGLGIMTDSVQVNAPPPGCLDLESGLLLQLAAG